jgi:hypothetical protein
LKRLPSTRGDRRLLRRWLLAWSALPAVLVLFLAAKLLSVGVLAGSAIRTFEAGDAHGVADAAAGLGIANIIEPHRAPFAEGDSLVLAGDFATARQRFEEALSLAGPEDACVIRVNLVLSIEHLGDERADAEDLAAAALLFAEGLAVVDSAPAGCFTSRGSGDSAGTGEKLDQAAARLEQKAADATGAAAGSRADYPEQDEQPSHPGRQSQLDQLQDSAREAQRERNTGQERDEYLRDEGRGAGPDRPW